MKISSWLFIPFFITLTLIFNIYKLGFISISNDFISISIFLFLIFFLSILLNGFIIYLISKYVKNFKLLFWLEMSLYILEIFLIFYFFDLYLPYSNQYFNLIKDVVISK